MTRMQKDGGYDLESRTGEFALAGRVLCIALLVSGLFVTADRTACGAGKLHLRVVGETAEPIPCRVHLKDAHGKPQRVRGLPFWRDHFVCPGTVEFELAAGEYSIEVERGPEYGRVGRAVTVADGDKTAVEVELVRMADLSALGWWSGDLHVHRGLDDIKLLMRAEDLHVAPVITWWNNRNFWSDRAIPKDALVKFDGSRHYHVMAGEDEREGGALLFFGLRRPLDLVGATREYPSPVKFVQSAREREAVWIDIEKPFWWDVPVWLASGQVDSVGLANNHMCRSQMYESEAWGRPRDAEQLPAPRGNGFWSQAIYYHILNTGLRLPPSAGSASGVLPNPVGYNRVYVHVGKELTYDGWWDGLKAGRSFVTNGPLLLCQANGRLPGHVFKATGEQDGTVSIEATVTTNDPIPAVEIIKNGEVIRRVPTPRLLEAPTTATVDLGTVTFDSSGWFLVRAITDNQRTFRFASTAPYYVEVGAAKKRISRRSVQFFLDWIDERMKRVKLTDPDQLRQVLKHHEDARRFWQERVGKANAE